MIPAPASAASSSWRWVVDGGWTTIVKTLPSDAVSSGIDRASMNARPADRPPASSKASIPPPTRQLAHRDVALGMARRATGGRRATRRPDARATRRVPRPSPTWRSIRIARVEMPRRTRNAEFGASEAPGVDLEERGPRRSGRAGRRRRRPGRRCGRTGTSSPTRRRDPPRARSAGRGTARRTCCRRRRARRGGGRGSARAAWSATTIVGFAIVSA